MRVRTALALIPAAPAALLCVPSLLLLWLAMLIAGRAVTIRATVDAFKRRRPSVLERQRVAPRTARGTLPPAPDLWRPSDGVSMDGADVTGGAS